VDSRDHDGEVPSVPIIVEPPRPAAGKASGYPHLSLKGVVGQVDHLWQLIGQPQHDGCRKGIDLPNDTVE
jgi:hypothetical protein